MDSKLPKGVPDHKPIVVEREYIESPTKVRVPTRLTCQRINKSLLAKSYNEFAIDYNRILDI